MASKIKKAVQVIFNVLATPPVQENGWRAAVLQRLQQEGHPARDVTDLSVGGSPAVCFEYDAAASPAKSAIACNADKRMEINFFFDDPKWIPKFYAILGGIRS